MRRAEQRAEVHTREALVLDIEPQKEVTSLQQDCLPQFARRCLPELRGVQGALGLQQASEAGMYLRMGIEVMAHANNATVRAEAVPRWFDACVRLCSAAWA
eukprot:3872963-Alexandrium_andersonii.AAC.1